jgi:hypothetical protein
MADLTILTAPKAFTNPHIATIQANAIASWKALGPQVEVLVLGEEDGLVEATAGLGVRHLPGVARNTNGTPLIHSMVQMAREASDSPLLAIVNADILLLPDFVQGALAVSAQEPNFLMVGQRWDLDVRERLDFSDGWPERLRQRAAREGQLHRASGSDYFIFPRDCFRDMPAFAIGRAGWDNWMIYAGRTRGWPVIDATEDIQIIHQNHDYAHLPGGQPHYRLPETFENIRLAGGKRAIFELPDCSHRLKGGQVQPLPFSWAKLKREAEIFPLVRLHSYALGQLAYALFHPRKAYYEFRTAASKETTEKG